MSEPHWERNEELYRAAIPMVFSGEYDDWTVLQLRDELHRQFVEEAESIELPESD